MHPEPNCTQWFHLRQTNPLSYQEQDAWRTFFQHSKCNDLEEEVGWAHFKSQINASWVVDQSLMHPSPSKCYRSTPHALFLPVKIRDADEIKTWSRNAKETFPKQGIIMWLLCLAKDAEVNTSWGLFPVCSMEVELEKRFLSKEKDFFFLKKRFEGVEHWLKDRVWQQSVDNVLFCHVRFPQQKQLVMVLWWKLS